MSNIPKRHSIDSTRHERIRTRLLKHVEKQSDGCWIWTATKGPKGYGYTLVITGENGFAHRVAFMVFKGPIPQGLEIPDELVTQALRGAACLPSILRLLARGGPATVLRSIRSIVVDAVDRVRRGRPLAHVFEERREALQPARADGDAASAVLGIVRSALVQAAILHAAPSLVLGRLGESVRSIRCRGPLALQAPAGLDLLPEVILPNRRPRSAVAFADPHAVSSARPRRLFDHDETPESTSTQIFASSKSHAWILLEALAWSAR